MKTANGVVLNPSTIRNELQPKNIPEDWRPRTEGLNQTIIRLIGGIRKLEHMDAAITFACGDGKTPATQAQVKEFLKRQKKTVGRKNKYLTGKLDGLTFTIELRPGETAEEAAKRLLVILKRLRKHRNAPAESLGYAFA